MKVIATKKFLKKVKAQMLYEPEIYDPDNVEEPLSLYDAKTFDIELPQEETGDLPTYTIEDIEGTIETGEEEDVESPEIVESSPEDIPTFPNTFQAFRYAKNEKKVIQITYICKSGVGPIVRDVEPHGDYWAATTHRRIFVTHDETVGSTKSYIMNNIQNYVFTGDDFTPKFNFSIERRNYKRRLRYRKNKRENRQSLRG